MQKVWEWILALEEPNGLESARRECLLALQVMDALIQSERGLAQLSHLLQLSAQAALKYNSLEYMLSVCGVLMNEWAIDSTKPASRQATTVSREFLQILAAGETTLHLTYQYLFHVDSQKHTRGQLQPSTKRVPLSTSQQTSTTDAAVPHSTPLFHTFQDSGGSKFWPFMGYSSLSERVLEPPLQPRLVRMRNKVAGALLLQRHRTSPAGTRQRNQLCNSRFASLVMNCTAGGLPVQPESSSSTSQRRNQNDDGTRPGRVMLSSLPVWHEITPQKADHVMLFGEDGASHPHSNLLASTALLGKELLYDMLDRSSEFDARERLFGFFAQDSPTLENSFAVTFPVLSFLLAWCARTACLVGVAAWYTDACTSCHLCRLLCLGTWHVTGGSILDCSLNEPACMHDLVAICILSIHQDMRCSHQSHVLL
jgi:hypothetical protein